MNVIVVDSSSWISYFKGLPRPSIDLALKEGRVYLAPIVAAELLSSQLKPSDRRKLVDFLSELPLCDLSFRHWAQVGALRSELAVQGLNLSTPDAHIAQCALDLEGYLLTEDTVFKKAAHFIPLRLMQD